jgi:hypothetical protein
MRTSSAYALLLLSLHVSSSSSSCLDALQKVETTRADLQKVESDLNTLAQTQSKFVNCFISHFPLVQYGCAAQKAGQLEMNGVAHIRQHVQFTDVGEHALKEGAQLKQVMDAAAAQCKTEPDYQSTNFDGNVLCLKTPCNPSRLVMKNPLDGKLDAKEIEPMQDERKGVGIDEVYRLS